MFVCVCVSVRFYKYQQNQIFFSFLFFKNNIQTHTDTHRHTHRHTHTQQTNKQTNKQTNIHTYTHIIFILCGFFSETKTYTNKQ